MAKLTQEAKDAKLAEARAVHEKAVKDAVDKLRSGGFGKDQDEASTAYGDAVVAAQAAWDAVVESVEYDEEAAAVVAAASSANAQIAQLAANVDKLTSMVTALLSKDTAPALAPAPASTTPSGKLPDDFPGKAALDEAGLTTYAKVRNYGDLTEVAGIGEATAAKIQERLAADGGA